VGIGHGRVQIVMAHQLLDRANIISGLQKMGCMSTPFIGR
jgi:hypothetical protein